MSWNLAGVTMCFEINPVLHHFLYNLFKGIVSWVQVIPGIADKNEQIYQKISLF
jgi:hypothetical protein